MVGRISHMVLPSRVLRKMLRTSWLRWITLSWCAARCELTKHSRVLRSRSASATPPLFLPMPSTPAARVCVCVCGLCVCGVVCVVLCVWCGVSGVVCVVCGECGVSVVSVPGILVLACAEGMYAHGVSCEVVAYLWVCTRSRRPTQRARAACERRRSA